MSELIDREAVVDMLQRLAYDDWNQGVCTSWANAYSECADMVEGIPSVDAVEVVRCKDCKHRWVNEHYGEKGYMKIKAMCSLDTGDPFELGRNAYDDDWYCADGERKDE